MAENASCGCDRDYLTVPLERAHVCPSPVITRDALNRFYYAVGYWPRYTRAESRIVVAA